MKEYDATDLPKTARVIVMMVERIGFPVVACLLMFYLGATSLHKIEVALNENTRALSQFMETTVRFQNAVLSEHRRMLEDLDSIRKNIRP